MSDTTFASEIARPYDRNIQLPKFYSSHGIDNIELLYASTDRSSMQNLQALVQILGIEELPNRFQAERT
jgi:hypothetical protein